MLQPVLGELMNDTVSEGLWGSTDMISAILGRPTSAQPPQPPHPSDAEAGSTHPGTQPPAAARPPPLVVQAVDAPEEGEAPTSPERLETPTTEAIDSALGSRGLRVTVPSSPGRQQPDPTLDSPTPDDIERRLDALLAGRARPREGLTVSVPDGPPAGGDGGDDGRPRSAPARLEEPSPAQIEERFDELLTPRAVSALGRVLHIHIPDGAASPARAAAADTAPPLTPPRLSTPTAEGVLQMLKLHTLRLDVPEEAPVDEGSPPRLFTPSAEEVERRLAPRSLKLEVPVQDAAPSSPPRLETPLPAEVDATIAAEATDGAEPLGEEWDDPRDAQDEIVAMLQARVGALEGELAALLRYA